MKGGLKKLEAPDKYRDASVTVLTHGQSDEINIQKNFV